MPGWPSGTIERRELGDPLRRDVGLTVWIIPVRLMLRCQYCRIVFLNLFIVFDGNRAWASLPSPPASLPAARGQFFGSLFPNPPSLCPAAPPARGQLFKNCSLFPASTPHCWPCQEIHIRLLFSVLPLLLLPCPLPQLPAMRRHVSSLSILPRPLVRSPRCPPRGDNDFLFIFLPLLPPLRCRPARWQFYGHARWQVGRQASWQIKFNSWQGSWQLNSLGSHGAAGQPLGKIKLGVLTRWQADRLGDSLAGRLAGRLAGTLAGRLAGWQPLGSC